MTPGTICVSENAITTFCCNSSLRCTGADGVGDNIDTDDDNDGVPDQIENAAPADIDGDGLANRIDLDSDGDTLPDIVEAGGIDKNSDALIDSARAESSLLNVPDTDGDGLPDLYDPESSNPANSGSGPFDIETGSWQSFDTDSNGILDNRDQGFVDNNRDTVSVIINKALVAVVEYAVAVGVERLPAASFYIERATA